RQFEVSTEGQQIPSEATMTDLFIDRLSAPGLGLTARRTSIVTEGKVGHDIVIKYAPNRNQPV
ncbi:unnamed protein product, partial [Rhizoctonia solani]